MFKNEYAVAENVQKKFAKGHLKSSKMNPSALTTKS